jgi:hypothetical protein
LSLFLLPRGRSCFSAMIVASSRLIMLASAMAIDKLNSEERIRKARCARKKRMWHRCLTVKQ